MKYLLVIAVVALVLWLMLGRSSGRGQGGKTVDRGTRPDREAAADPPAVMVACAHCGTHLPAPEALTGGDGQPYCSPAHLTAGPR